MQAAVQRPNRRDSPTTMPDSSARPGSPAPPLGPPSGALPAVWLDADLDDIVASLALDEALLEEAHEGVTTAVVVRTWMAKRPVVVVGSSSRVDQEVDRDACRQAGVPILRRPSGGATVILGPGCLMWSVVTPHPHGVPAVERIHAAMLEPLVTALCDRGLAVSRQGTSDLVLALPHSAAAVTPPVPRKISGNALRVRRHGVLYHGTLLDDFDISLAERLLKHPPREPDYRGRRPHSAFLANVGLGRQALEALVRMAFGVAADAARITSWSAERVERLVRERYADATWTDRL